MKFESIHENQSGDMHVLVVLRGLSQAVIGRRSYSVQTVTKKTAGTLLLSREIPLGRLGVFNTSYSATIHHWCWRARLRKPT
jgi:hypothetical protein